MFKDAAVLTGLWYDLSGVYMGGPALRKNVHKYSNELFMIIKTNQIY